MGLARMVTITAQYGGSVLLACDVTVNTPRGIMGEQLRVLEARESMAKKGTENDTGLDRTLRYMGTEMGIEI